MRILALEITGFRGIGKAGLYFSDHLALVGPNGAGKSTVVDALSLVLGRQKMVRELTEHDFTGSSPRPQDRIRIVATIGGFATNDATNHPQWFRHDRGVDKWWNPRSHAAEAVPSVGAELCVQIAFAARFDHEELAVEQKRYFVDDDLAMDPFIDESVKLVPQRLLQQLGFFVLPARRTWPSTISFSSDLFRKAIATLGGVPASAVLAHRDGLRSPPSPLELDPSLQPLIARINSRLAQLLPSRPTLELRVTATDSESLLDALVPHFRGSDGFCLPAGRHGTGLLSLQSLVLLLEIGRARTEAGESFILALEEPELHVPPGLQRRLIGDATKVSNQVICTTHSPRVAAFFEAQKIQMLRQVPDQEVEATRLESSALAPASMVDEPNSLVQLYTDSRSDLVEALMFPAVLVPEGRVDFAWLRRLLDVAETGAKPLDSGTATAAPFGSVVGVVPTRDAAVETTFERLRALHPRVCALVDGDAAGDDYVDRLLRCTPPPAAVIQWPNGLTIEDVVHWILAAGEEQSVLAQLRQRLNRALETLDVLLTDLRNGDGRTGGLKTHYMAHEEIAGVMKASPQCGRRIEVVLDALARAVLAQHEGCASLELVVRPALFLLYSVEGGSSSADLVENALG